MEETELSPGPVLRAMAWLVRKAGVRNLVVWLLFSVALASLIFGLADAVRGLDAGLVFPIAATGALSGWLLGRQRRRWSAAIWLLLLGLIVVVVRVGNLTRQAASFFVELNAVILGYRQPQPGLLLPDGAPMLAALSALTSGAQALLTRGWTWLEGVRQGQPAYDPAATALLWSLAVWAACGWAGLELRRGSRPLAALTPAGVLLGATLAFVRAPGWYLLPFLAAWLSLSAFLTYRGEQQRWEATGVDFSEDVRLDIAMAVVVAILGITLLAWVSPLVRLHNLLDIFNRPRPATSEESKQVGKSLGLETHPQPRSRAALEELRSGGLPRDHLLGSGPELTRQVVLVVRTGELPAGPPDQVLRNPAPRHYWRSLTYDQYTGRGWFAGSSEIAGYRSGEATIAWGGPPAGVELQAGGRRLVSQQVQRVEKETGEFLYTAGWLLSAESDYSAAWRKPPPSGAQSGGAPTDNLLQQADLFGATTQSDEYRAISIENIPGASILRAAGSEYPEWVKVRYLRLPDSIPARVLGLARDLTAAQPTPYDRALAIEHYLRTFEYTLNLPAPPGDRDVVDYFLFDLKKGYCDYFASAMVVLARAAGLPARLVVGYASGSYDAYSAEYRVTAADAHSWPEIYFPGAGWVEFEPTAGRPEVGHGDPQVITSQEAVPPAIAPGSPAWQEWIRPVVLVLLAALCGMIFAGLAVWGLDEWRLRRLAPISAVAAVFARFRRLGSRMALPVHAGDTPCEYAGIFAGRWQPGAREGATTGSHKATDAGWLLARLYSTSAFGPRPPTEIDRREALRAWREVRWRVKWERFLRRIAYKRGSQAG